MKTLLCYITLLLATVHCIVVEIPNGKLLGSFNGEYHSFTNIPYAAAPVGANRFQAPLPYTETWDDIRNVTSEPVSCVKFTKTLSPSNGIEDCLTLNIYTRIIDPGNLLTVRVFFHGGGFMIGAAGDTGEENIVRKNIVLVMPNYRLGAFGFLSSGDELVSGNFGLKDQQLALKWIYANIHTFGGDAKRIQVTGVSAGGASAHLHLLNRGSCPFITCVLSSSGSALNPWVMQPNPAEQFKKYKQFIGCDLPSNEQVKECLQTRTKEEHFAATNALKGIDFFDNPFNVFGVVVESKKVRNAFLTEHPLALMKKGQICDVPLVLAHSTREGTYTASEFMAFDANGKELIEVLNTRWNELAPILLFYNNSCVNCSPKKANEFRDKYSNFLKKVYMQGQHFSAETYLLLEKMFTDILFVNGIKMAVDLHRIYGKSPVYAYEYNHSSPGTFSVGNFLSNRSDLDFGAAHGNDNQFILELKEFTTPNTVHTPEDKFVAENLIEMSRLLSITGVAFYDSKILPINTAVQTGKLTIHSTYYVLETCQLFGICSKEIFLNNT